MVRSEMPEAQVGQMLPGLSKIASWEQINGLVRAAASGVPLQLTHRPPPEIPIRNGVTYFMLNLQNAYWQSILRERTVAVYLPPPFEPPRTRLELLAVPRAT